VPGRIRSLTSIARACSSVVIPKFPTFRSRGLRRTTGTARAPQLLETLTAEYQANGRRSQDRLAVSLTHLRPALGAARAAHLTSADVTAYVMARQTEKTADGTVRKRPMRQSTGNWPR
jgi:hypothetical protein